MPEEEPPPKLRPPIEELPLKLRLGELKLPLGEPKERLEVVELVENLF